MAQSKMPSTGNPSTGNPPSGNPPSSSQSSQKKKIEPSNLIADEGRDTTTHIGFRTLAFPPQIHPRPKSFNPSEKISVVGKEVATANYERDTFLKAGIKIEESRETAPALNLPPDRSASVDAAAAAKQENGENWFPKFPEGAIRKEDFKILWRR